MRYVSHILYFFERGIYMAKLLINQNLKNKTHEIRETYDKQIYTDYSLLFEKKATYVTYYMQSEKNSTYDKHLHNAVLIGPNSPIKFDKILDVPLHGMTFDFEEEYEEVHGIKHVASGECFITCANFEPLHNDIFIIPHLETRLMMTVTDVSFERIEGQTFYKINYKIAHFSEADVNRQVSAEFVYDVNKIGSDDVVIRRDRSILNTETDILIRNMRQEYIKLFYIEPISACAVKVVHMDKIVHLIYDTQLNSFCKHKALLSESVFYGYTNITMYKGLIDEDVYRSSFYPHLPLIKTDSKCKVFCNLSVMFTRQRLQKISTNFSMLPLSVNTLVDIEYTTDPEKKMLAVFDTSKPNKYTDILKLYKPGLDITEFRNIIRMTQDVFKSVQELPIASDISVINDATKVDSQLIVTELLEAYYGLLFLIHMLNEIRA